MSDVNTAADLNVGTICFKQRWLTLVCNLVGMCFAFKPKEEKREEKELHVVLLVAIMLYFRPHLAH